jgi:hypothetical protein
MINNTMPEKLRKLYLSVWAGVTPVHAITVPMHYLDCMFPREKLEEALKYLLKNGITGPLFIEWYYSTCHASNLEMHRELMRAVEKERHLRKLSVKDLR